MAKWGEGDPRWIVEERPDATNVNNWHWTEKNAGPWSKDKLKELLGELDLSGNSIECKVKEMDKCTGEASANNRKGKLIFFYEWNIKLKWEGRLAGGSELVKGNIEIPNLSEENDLDDIEITVTIEENSDEGLRIKEYIHNFARKKIRELLGLYISSLREEFSKGMILPKKDEAPVKPDHVSSITSGFNKKINMAPIEDTSKKSQQSKGLKLNVDTVRITKQFQCRAHEFYDAMTKIEMVMAFTRGPVTLQPEKGGKFALFNGNISGEFTELIPGRKIEQLWRYKQWPEGHFSNVSIDIEQQSDHTLVTLKQTGVPASDVEMTKQNWERYYWESIQRTFGFGAFL